jgi:hypothetical protein
VISYFPSEPWQDPQPLTTSPPDLNLETTIPTSLGWLQKFVAQTAASIQVDPGMVLPIALSTASMAVSKAVAYAGFQSHVEQPPIWTATVAPPSARKSSVAKRVTSPISSDFWQNRPKGNGSGRRSNRYRGLGVDEGLYARSDDYDPADWWKPADFGGGGVGEPRKPRKIQETSGSGQYPLIVSDVTEQGLARLASKNGDRAGIFAAEGATLLKILGQGNGQISLSTLLSGWSGENVLIQRANREPITLHEFELVVGLLVQPDIIHLLTTHRAAVGQGLAARFLISVPKPCPGKYLDAGEIEPHIEFQWHNVISKLNKMPRPEQDGVITRKITMSSSAIGLLAAYHDEIRARMNPAQDTRLADWQGKAHGQALRIAGAYALLKSEDAKSIEVDDLMPAITMMRYFEAHFASLLTSGSIDGFWSHAQRALDHLRSLHVSTVTESAVTQALRGSGREHVRDWEPIFAALAEKGWVRREICKSESPAGGRPSRLLHLHPTLNLGIG